MSHSFEELVALAQSAIQCHATGEWESAVQIWRRILQVDPEWESGDGWYNLGVCLEMLNRPMDARTPYLRALANFPWNPVFLATWAAWCEDYAAEAEQLDAELRHLVAWSPWGALEAPPELPLRVSELASRLGVCDEEIRRTLAARLRARETGKEWLDPNRQESGWPPV